MGFIHSNATTSGDGSYVRIDGESYNPESAACVVYSTAVRDSNSLIETGLVRCGAGAVVDNNTNCNNTVFVESLHTDSSGNTSATCWAHGTISNGTYYIVSVRRDSQTGTDFYPILFQSQTAYPNEDRTGLGQTVDLWSWAEHTNHDTNTHCSDWGSGHANFSNWQHLHIGTGWVYEANSTADKDWLLDVGVPSYHCWDITNLNGSGDFSVDK